MVAYRSTRHRISGIAIPRVRTYEQSESEEQAPANLDRPRPDHTIIELSLSDRRERLMHHLPRDLAIKTIIAG